MVQTPACSDIWLVGDGFLNDIFGAYQTLEYQAFRNKKLTQFYMSDYYNVRHFCNRTATGASSSNATARIIEAINSGNILPKMLLVMMDKDLIESINLFDFGAYKVMAQVVNWLTRQIDILVRRKKLQILER